MRIYEYEFYLKFNSLKFVKIKFEIRMFAYDDIKVCVCVCVLPNR